MPVFATRIPNLEAPKADPLLVVNVIAPVTVWVALGVENVVYTATPVVFNAPLANAAGNPPDIFVTKDAKLPPLSTARREVFKLVPAFTVTAPDTA